MPLTTIAPRSRPSQAPLMALPFPILRCLSRLHSTALRLTQGHTGGAAAPRGGRCISYPQPGLVEGFGTCLGVTLCQEHRELRA